MPGVPVAHSATCRINATFGCHIHRNQSCLCIILLQWETTVLLACRMLDGCGLSQLPSEVAELTQVMKL